MTSIDATKEPSAPIAAPDPLSGEYHLDPSHSELAFVVRHAMVTKVRGTFRDVRGSGYFDAQHPERSHFEVTIDAASVDTRNSDRDAHLRSADFFDAERYPELRFQSTSVNQVSERTYRVTGDLTIRDVTRPLTFELQLAGPATDAFGNERIGLEGQTVVSRKDWGLTWNAALEAGGVLVSDNVTLQFDISAVRVPSGG